LLFKTRNFPRLRLSKSSTSIFLSTLVARGSVSFAFGKFCPELRKNALIISQSYSCDFALYMIKSVSVTYASNGTERSHSVVIESWDNIVQN
jgi:hypothetical protein